jgi:hypothetical protein
MLSIPDRLLNKKIEHVVIAIILIFLSVNTIVFKKESKKVQNFLAGLEIEIPKGSFLMTYKNPVNVWARVDTIRHAAQYYSIRNKCVDIGNYQAATDFFLIEFTKNSPEFPTISQIENKPESIDLSLYPSIQYILGHNLSEIDKKRLRDFFINIFENNELSMWRRKQS